MASEEQVREYLAHWFQLGKKVVINNGAEVLLPEPLFRGSRYSDEFEACWQRIVSPEAGDCYLEGTHETISELLNPQWEVVMCGRCDMPITLPTVGMPPESCPCKYLPNWPNTEVPLPRSPVNTQAHLRGIHSRLLNSAPQLPQESSTSETQQIPLPIRLELRVCPHSSKI